MLCMRSVKNGKLFEDISARGFDVWRSMPSILSTSALR